MENIWQDIDINIKSMSPIVSSEDIDNSTMDNYSNDVDEYQDRRQDLAEVQWLEDMLEGTPTEPTISPTTEPTISPTTEPTISPTEPPMPTYAPSLSWTFIDE